MCPMAPVLSAMQGKDIHKLRFVKVLRVAQKKADGRMAESSAVRKGVLFD